MLVTPHLLIDAEASPQLQQHSIILLAQCQFGPAAWLNDTSNRCLDQHSISWQTSRLGDLTLVRAVVQHLTAKEWTTAMGVLAKIKRMRRDGWGIVGKVSEPIVRRLT